MRSKVKRMGLGEKVKDAVVEGQNVFYNRKPLAPAECGDV